MGTKKRMRLMTTPLALFGLAGVAVTAPGCDEDNPLCCNENDFQVGGSIQIEGQAGVAVQAVADFGGISAGMVADITTACRSMAENLDVPAADRDAAESNPDNRAKMNAYCDLAISAITSFKATAGGSIKIVAEPPQCSASVSAKANCQAKCSVDASCDIKANPPQCTGGKLEISCSGSCSAEAGATVSCEGSCSGSCEGSCTADAGGVECAGKCEGTCTAGGAAGGTGIQADGTCEGMCEGTCEVTAPMAECNGSCKGQCTAACEASASASVKCDGSCDGDFEPISCEGGTLEGGCEVDAECDASCDASVSAKAECTPPSVSIEFSGAADIQAAGKLKFALEASYGLILGLGARVEGMLQLTGTFAGAINADVLAEIKPACIPTVIAAVGEGIADVEAVGSATLDITAAVGG